MIFLIHSPNPIDFPNLTGIQGWRREHGWKSVFPK
jgi:hypothetical protein